jgi:hypothetical protein
MMGNVKYLPAVVGKTEECKTDECKTDECKMPAHRGG